MPNDLKSLMIPQSPTSERPLLGLTVLIVEDSRFASEALRLLCLRSGARIRRADTLANARKHLRVYRPNIVIVDLGLPDGSGAELIEEMSETSPRVDVILGMSGDTGTQDISDKAGADGFVEKPIASLGVFQEIILNTLPAEARPNGLRAVSTEVVNPDPIALQDDFTHIADILSASHSEDMLDYIAQFLSSIARTAGDAEMATAATSLASRREQGQSFEADVVHISQLVQSRISKAAVI